MCCTQSSATALKRSVRLFGARLEVHRNTFANLRLDGYPKQELNRASAEDRLWLRSFPQQSINDQEDDGADGGDENSTEVERLNLPEPNEAAQKTADDRAGYADEDRNDNPARVLPGHNELQRFIKLSFEKAQEQVLNG